MEAYDLATLAALNWPGARLQKVVTRPDPAAGADFSFRVPGNEVWKPISLAARFATSAAVANRAPTLEASYGGSRFLAVRPNANQAASTSVVWCWFIGGHQSSFGTTNSRSHAPIPDVVLQAGATLDIATTAIDVGDQWTEIALLVEVTNNFDPTFLATLLRTFDRERDERFTEIGGS